MTITKKEVADFIKQQGGTPHYSGKRKTMFISAPFNEHIDKAVLVEVRVLRQFKNLPFSLVSSSAVKPESHGK